MNILELGNMYLEPHTYILSSFKIIFNFFQQVDFYFYQKR